MSSVRLGFLIARQNVIRSFPRREEVEVAELLTQLHRFVGDALQLIVVTNFNETGEREVLAQRMTFKTVVGQDAAQVRMAGEQDAVLS
jgi:hypothetical protein